MTTAENLPIGVDRRRSGLADLDGPWEAPGPGLWERDPAHQERPFSRLCLEVLSEAFPRGTAEGFERLGLPLAEMRVVDVGGWFYGTMLPIPDEDFEARIQAAEQALAARTWRTIADEWHRTERDRFQIRNHDLQAVDPVDLDDEALVVHTLDALDLLADAGARHFLQSIAHWVGVGLLVNEATELAGWEPPATIAALAGSSPGSTAPVAAIHAILDAVAADRSAAALLAGVADASSTLDAMRASSPAVRQAIDAYFDEFGWQIFTGFDVTHQAIVELPSLFLSTLRAAAQVPAPTSDRLAALLAAAPATHRDRVAQLIDDAITLYGVRDDDSGLTIQRPLGLVRRALLEAGRRSAAAGRLDDPDHIFDARRDDLGALITGRGPAPHADALGALSRRRHGPVTSPPLRLGDEGAPPDDELPAAMGLIVGALLTAMSLEVTDPGEPTEDRRQLRGCGASAGVYEGRAHVVDSDVGFEDIEAGDVLIAMMTTPAYNVVVPLLGAVVTDTGGVLCHAAIVAREFGIPAVVGTAAATTDIPDGTYVRVDGNEGIVTIL